MFLSCSVTFRDKTSLPRASGGVSIWHEILGSANQSSPRKRGCFPFIVNKVISAEVFPAQAGVFPSPLDHSESALGLPRASGGVSVYSVFDAKRAASSPRKRGCFRHAARREVEEMVFPAQAGVFPYRLRPARLPACLPRASGGVSDTGAQITDHAYVFPAQAGVFPIPAIEPNAGLSLPRASGGVSSVGLSSERTNKSSPRKRGCFHWIAGRPTADAVFPAQAGVFLSIHQVLKEVGSLPRASGGVSALAAGCDSAAGSSPRKRGHFSVTFVRSAGYPTLSEEL